jgi:hypothetical protein
MQIPERRRFRRLEEPFRDWFADEKMNLLSHEKYSDRR